jgi:Ca-activated chloride channel family protein
MTNRRLVPFIFLAIIFLSVLLACGLTPGGNSENKLTVLAGSELKDLEPLFGDIRKNTGVELVMSYTGTLDGAEKLIAGEPVDLAWFSHAKYLNLIQEAKSRILAQEKIMLSPVILGVKKSKAEAWGWVDNPDLTWKDVVDKASTGELHYAMTNPASSNSGFTALVGAAAALSGSGEALQLADIDKVNDQLKEFFKGQALTAGSSGWLADQYVLEQDRLDGIINYESVLLSLNKSGKLHEPLYLIYPKEGILTADYPLLLINGQKRDAYNRLVEYLRSPVFQKKMMELTLRRPVIPGVPLSTDFPDRLLVELPFPSSREVVDRLLFAYLDQQSIPPHAFFVLDVSGSMEGERLDSLIDAMNRLTGMDTSLTGQFARFRDRERVTIITFSGEIQDQKDFEVDLKRPETIQAIQDFVSSLQADGNTAIFSTLKEAYVLAIQARQQDPTRYYSIVLMSDGENTAGESLRDFTNFYKSSPEAVNIKTFVILFGEAKVNDMQTIADLTGGRLFDARSTPLQDIFKEIRGYQ